MLAFCLAGPALASDKSPAEQAAAKALFDEGKALYEKGQLEEACQRFEAARRIESTPGTLLNLARCHEKLGRTASAYGALDEAVTVARRLGDEERRAYAERWMKELEPQLSRLRVEVERAEGDLSIQLDGKELHPGALGTAIPVDPGKHTVEAAGRGRAPFRTTVDVEPRPGTVTVRVPAQAATTTTTTPPARPKPPPPGPPYWNGQRIGGVALGAAGIAGITVGAVYGVKAAQSMAGSDERCIQGNPDRCTPEGYALRQDANTQGWISNVGIGAGALAVAGGVVLFLLAPKPAPAKRDATARIELSPLLGGGLGGIAARGAF